jgi:uncharacterized phage-like protein YoqJ
MILAGTGHRPQQLIVAGVNAFDARVHARLVALARAALRRYRPALVISGMALGFDTALADAAVAEGVPFDAYVPFVGQDGAWNAAAQARYRALLAAARQTVVVCDGGYAAWKMQKRNVAMVDACTDLLSLWDGSPGGTANCVAYAQRTGRSIIPLWPSWARYADHGPSRSPTPRPPTRGAR